jgi:hypothetical protein
MKKIIITDCRLCPNYNLYDTESPAICNKAYKKFPMFPDFKKIPGWCPLEDDK